MPTTWPLWGYSTWHQISLVRRYISDDFWTLLEQTLPVNQISPVGIGKSTDIKSLFLYTSSIMHHITIYSTVGMRDTNRSIDTKSFASGDSGWNPSAWKHQSNCDTPPLPARNSRGYTICWMRCGLGLNIKCSSCPLLCTPHAEGGFGLPDAVR